MKNGDQHICNFCGDSDKEVEYMIVSPNGACICGDCIGESVITLEEMQENEPVGLLH
jgi:hypothetical protein